MGEAGAVPEAGGGVGVDIEAVGDVAELELGAVDGAGGGVGEVGSAGAVHDDLAHQQFDAVAA